MFPIKTEEVAAHHKGRLVAAITANNIQLTLHADFFKYHVLNEKIFIIFIHFVGRIMTLTNL